MDKIERNKELNLHERIHAIMSEVEYLKKDDTIAFGNTKYTAMSEEKVTSTLRQYMVKYGVVMLPVSVTLTKEGSLSTVHAGYRLVNIDRPDDDCYIESCGQGADTQDKGSGKAMTYSFKYALLRAFCIPTGEDPDKISSDEFTEKEKRLKEAEAKAKELADKKAKEEKTAGNTAGTTEKNNTQDLSADNKAKFLATVKELILTSAQFVNAYGLPKNPEDMITLFKPIGDSNLLNEIVKFHKFVSPLLKGEKAGVGGFIKSIGIETATIPALMKSTDKLKGQVEYYLGEITK